MRLILCTLALAVAACSTVKPVDTAGVPPPWPAPSPTLVERQRAATPAPPEGKPPVPPQKDQVVPKTPTPPSSLASN